MILLSHLKTGISASQYAKQFIRTATREREPKKFRGHIIVQNKPGRRGRVLALFILSALMRLMIGTKRV